MQQAIAAISTGPKQQAMNFTLFKMNAILDTWAAYACFVAFVLEQAIPDLQIQWKMLSARTRTLACAFGPPMLFLRPVKLQIAVFPIVSVERNSCDIACCTAVL
jgi:hypothetical protein